jgi:hypothetical protein
MVVAVDVGAHGLVGVGDRPILPRGCRYQDLRVQAPAVAVTVVVVTAMTVAARAMAVRAMVVVTMAMVTTSLVLATVAGSQGTTLLAAGPLRRRLMHTRPQWATRASVLGLARKLPGRSQCMPSQVAGVAIRTMQ